MFSLDQPLWLSLFLIFPLLFWARYYWRRRSGRVIFAYRIWSGDGFWPPGTWLRFIVIFSSVLSILGISFLIFALAGPELIEQEEIHYSRGIDIMVVLDQSPSMGARDFPPENRFESARLMIRRFIKGRKGDSIGLVSFGSSAMLRSPPTLDYDWLLARMNELQLQELGDGTAIGMGLAVAILHLMDSTAEEKVILLLTDGDDNAGEIRPETSANIAADNGIRVYIIGIGSEGESSIELLNPDTGTRTRGMITSEFDEEFLKSLAETTGGAYWKAATVGTLESVFQTVDALEAVERRIGLQTLSHPIHRSIIIAGLAALALAYFIRRIILGETP